MTDEMMANAKFRFPQNTPQNKEEYRYRTVRKLGKLHLYDCLRANKALMSWGIEGRVPFLDKEFMDIAMTVNPADKMVTAHDTHI